MVRFALYLGILLVIWTGNTMYLSLPVIALGSTYVILNYHPETFVDNLFSNVLDDPKITVNEENGKLCQLPDSNNPFMNVLISDYSNRATRPEACTTEVAKESTENHFNTHLYKNVNDIWNKNNSQRQFYTNPSTTIPNDRSSFMKWCWKTTAVCKDGDQEACHDYVGLGDGHPHGKIF